VWFSWVILRRRRFKYRSLTIFPVQVPLTPTTVTPLCGEEDERGPMMIQIETQSADHKNVHDTDAWMTKDGRFGF
jgi:hypothetical protein